MSASSSNSHGHILQRAAAAAAQAARLRYAAVGLRRLAGKVRYHPTTGQKPQLTPPLTAALNAMTDVLNDLQRGAADRADEEAMFATQGDAAARQVRQGHVAIDQGTQATAAAIGVLRGIFVDSGGATIDAPYGASAPRRHHPGALCTIVAERAEGLASALESLAIIKANLAA